MKKKVAVVTGTRAEYGLLKWLMVEIQRSEQLSLQLYVTGQHLSAQHGLTYQEIIQDGFDIQASIDMKLTSDTPVGIAHSMSEGLIGFSEAFDQFRPDLVLILGDRFELLSVATAAMLAQIPIAHLHGGETTEGAFDESIRHALTKMAHVHFVAAEPYRQRVLQLGEAPDRVFLVGGLGVDAFMKIDWVDQSVLEQRLNLSLAKPTLLVTYHPVTLETNSDDQLEQLLLALDALPETAIIFTAPNADPHNQVMVKQIEAFCASHSNARFVVSLGQATYFSCLRHVEAVVGNSSSGLTEAPSFKIPTINIGNRQRGRLKAASVIDCEPTRDAILAALTESRSPAFRAQLDSVVNPYGEGGASQKIVAILASMGFDELLKKRFYDHSIGI